MARFSDIFGVPYHPYRYLPHPPKKNDMIEYTDVNYEYVLGDAQELSLSFDSGAEFVGQIATVRFKDYQTGDLAYEEEVKLERAFGNALQAKICPRYRGKYKLEIYIGEPDSDIKRHIFNCVIVAEGPAPKPDEPRYFTSTDIWSAYEDEDEIPDGFPVNEEGYPNDSTEWITREEHERILSNLSQRIADLEKGVHELRDRGVKQGMAYHLR